MEDDRQTRIALSRLLNLGGSPNRIAATLAQAMELLDSDVRNVILDLMLPDGSGIDLLRMIRAKNLAIRVAVTSGTYDPDLMHDVRELRPDRVFVKPIPIVELLDWVQL